MDLREKVALALDKSLAFDVEFDTLANALTREEQRKLAQAAIDTVFDELREVTPGMAIAGSETWLTSRTRSVGDDARNAFLAMLDVAQKGE